VEVGKRTWLGGWAGSLPARGWDKGSRIGVDVRGLHQKKHTLLEVDTDTKKKTLHNY
jgi:hypothetical protein